MLVWIAALLAFVTVAGLGFVFSSPGAARAKVSKRVQVVTGNAGTRQAQKGRLRSAATKLEDRRQQIIKSLRDQERPKATLNPSSLITQAGLTISSNLFWTLSGVLGLILFVIIFMVGLNPLVALGVGLAAAAGFPRWVLVQLGTRRVKAFTSHFADALDIIVRGIKSGLPVHDSLRIVAEESPEPLAGEFKRVLENVGVGMSLDQALDKSYERMPTSGLRFFSIVLAIQQKTGGNLAEALNNLSTVLRARRMMREEIKALSSEAIASSFIIGSLPPGVVTLISITAPSYMSTMFTDPRGHMFLGGAAIWMSLGILTMRKMINFKI